MNRIDELESVLSNVIEVNPKNNQLKYCLAGCLYRLSRFDECEVLVADILRDKPDDKDAMDLKRMLSEKRTATSPGSEETTAALKKLYALEQRKAIKTTKRF